MAMGVFAGGEGGRPTFGKVGWHALVYILTRNRIQNYFLMTKENNYFFF